MRKPNIKDVFLASKIARKINIKELEFDAKGTPEEVGKKVIFFLLENMDKAEDEICELFSGILETEKEEFMTMSLDELFEKVKSIKGLGDFFSQAYKSTTSKPTMLSCVGTGM